MLDCADNVMPSLMGHKISPDYVSIVSGLSGVFSAFKVHVMRAAKTSRMDAGDIFMEVGRRKSVDEREDIIVEVSQDLMQKKLQRDEDYQIEALL